MSASEPRTASSLHPRTRTSSSARRLGTDQIYRFKSSSQERKPEELSAEILKSLKGDVQHWCNGSAACQSTRGGIRDRDGFG
jgi:hypothetical protein